MEQYPVFTPVLVYQISQFSRKIAWLYVHLVTGLRYKFCLQNFSIDKDSLRSIIIWKTFFSEQI